MKKKDVTISRKLSYLIWITSGSALLVASLGLTAFEFFSYKSLLEVDLSTKTELVGQNASAALHFNDSEGAQDILAALQADSAIEYAGLLDGAGNLIATYLSPAAEGIPAGFINLNKTQQYIGLHFADFYRPIYFDEEQVGAIFIRYSMARFYTLQLQQLGILAIVLLLATFIVALISPRLKREITLPILDLVETSKKVSALKDYTVRVPEESKINNELGILITAFNEMLDQIDKREQDLARHRNHLEELVQERTSQLYETNIKLQTAKDEAEAASQFKSILLNNITHEFRTPLNGILGAVAILEEEVPEDAIEFVDIINSSGTRLLDLLTTFLNFANLDKDARVFSHKPMDIPSVLNTIIPTFDKLTREKDIELHVDTSNVSRMIDMDPLAFRLILEPLLSNAVKFTESGAVTLKIQTSELTFNISLSDTGIGIDQEFQQDMYEPFTQESDGLSRSYEGVGLGLALFKRVCDLLKGVVVVDSHKGQGTTFDITIPSKTNIGASKEVNMIEA